MWPRLSPMGFSPKLCSLPGSGVSLSSKSSSADGLGCVGWEMSSLPLPVDCSVGMGDGGCGSALGHLVVC